MNSNAGWELRIRENVRKELARLLATDRNRIIQAIDSLIFNPYGGDIEKLKGEDNVWRRRIGSYRIFYEIIANEKAIYVYRVERRTSKTY